MPSLPNDALPAAEFIVRHMHRTVDLADGVQFSAVPETAQPINGDNWFWTDDNAKVLEFLSRPELWARFPEETASILRFVRAMCRGPFIFRRLSTPQLAAAEGDGTAGAYRHSLLSIQYDLRRGGIVVGMRFHDERNFDNLLLCGNSVEFAYENRRFILPVERAIGDGEASQNGHVLTLRHSGDLYFSPKRQSLRAGRITYLYSFDARSLLMGVEARFETDPGLELSDVVLTIGHDQLSRWYYSTVDADTRQTAGPLFSAGKPDRKRVDVAGASYYAIRQGHFSGDALALHTAPRDPARLTEIDTTGEIPGRLHRAVARYSFPGRHRGVVLSVAEDKVLTGGGLYERVADYAGFMRDAVANKAVQQAAYDFSTSYDYGVVINAFAKCFASCAALPDTDGLRAELRALIDDQLKYFLEFTIEGHRAGKNTVFSRELAFVILGAVTMYRAIGAEEYRGYLGRLCEALLDLERQYSDPGGQPASGFIMRIDALPIAHVDCHSASLLALVLAAGIIDDPRLIAAIDRGLGAYCLETAAVDVGAPYRVDTVGTLLIDPEGTRRSEPAFWNFKVGLTLRLFAALRGATEPRLREIAARHRERMDLFERILRHQLEHSISEHEDAVELRCCTLSAETNSETQPWVMLGLLGHPAD